MNDHSNQRIVTVNFNADGYQLKGHLHLPTTPAAPMVIGSHGLLADSRSPKLLALARQCNRCGMEFFRFDHRGCGESEGIFEDGTSLKARRNDLIAALEALQRMGHAKNGIGLFGSSMGGATSLAVATNWPVDAIVTYAAPIRSPWEAAARVSGGIHWRPPTGTRIQFDVSLDLSAVHHILILHGNADTVVPIQHGREIYKQAHPPKRMIIQKGGDHPMSLPAHQNAFIREAVYWFKVCLESS